MSNSLDASGSRLISKSEFLSSLPPWRRWLARLNWHPTVDARIRELESEIRLQQAEKEIERLKSVNEQLAGIESRLDALLLNADSSLLTPPSADSN
jgi:hypothetical protein